MRILQVNKYNYLRGGAEKYFIELSKELERAGHQVAIFSMRHPKNLPSLWEKYFVSRVSFSENSLYYSLLRPFRVLYSFEAKRKFSKLIKKFKPDIIHIHNIYHQISPSILPVAKKYNIPVVMHLHDYKLICPNYQLLSQGQICYRCLPNKYSQCIKQKCFKDSFWKSLLATIEMTLHHKILHIYKKNINLFIAPSNFMKRTVTAFSWPDDKIKLIYNFPQKMNFDIKSEIGDYGLYFGRISKEKGINVLLEALSLSKTKIKFKIVGSGPEEKNYLASVKALGLSEQVEFLGPKFDKELFEIIAKAKFIVLPSIWAENMPLTLLESMMAKKVVLVSKTGGLPELIDDRENGFVFKNGDARNLARVIDSLPNYNLMEMGEKAQKRVEDLVIEKHLLKILDVYKNLIDGRI